MCLSLMSAGTEEVPCDGLSTNAREYFTRKEQKSVVLLFLLIISYLPKTCLRLNYVPKI